MTSDSRDRGYAGWECPRMPRYSARQDRDGRDRGSGAHRARSRSEASRAFHLSLAMTDGRTPRARSRADAGARVAPSLGRRACRACSTPTTSCPRGHALRLRRIAAKKPQTIRAGLPNKHTRLRNTCYPVREADRQEISSIVVPRGGRPKDLWLPSQLS